MGPRSRRPDATPRPPSLACRYCSEACSQADWRRPGAGPDVGHKRACRALAAVRAAERAAAAAGREDAAAQTAAAVAAAAAAAAAAPM